MAFWQYSFWAVPRGGLISKYGDIPNKITEGDFNDLKWFDGFDKDKFVKSVECLPVNTHWNSNSLFWGNYDGDSITLTMDGSLVRDIYFRVDLRGGNNLMLSKFIDLLYLNQLMVLDEEMEVIYPNPDELIERIKINIDCKYNSLKNKLN